MPWSRPTARKWIPAARWLFTLIAIICTSCSAVQITAGFPDVPPPPPPKPDAPRIGLARVTDARENHIAGWVSNANANVLVGSELNDYIERTFKTKLVADGFAPVDALSPASSSNPAETKTIVVTVQSVSITNLNELFSPPTASINMAVQVYAPRNPQVVFAQSYSGAHSERLGFGGTGMRCGEITAAATNEAIDAAFADPGFKKALR